MKQRLSILLSVIVLFGCVYVSKADQYGSNVQDNGFQGKVKIGMTQEQVVEQWGEPDKIIKKQKKDYDEIWIYIPHWKFKNYLYFKNGVLIRGDPNPEDLV